MDRKKQEIVILDEKVEDGERVIRMKVGRTRVTVRRPLVPKEEDLIRLYDTCNEIFRGRPECFYTPEQTKEKNRLIAEQQMMMKNKETLTE